MKSILTILSLLLAVVSSTAILAAETAADAVSVSDAYVREVPPVSQTTGAFLTLSNKDTQDHAVVAAKSPAAEIVELHTHIMGDDGMHRMRELEKMEIPAGGETRLQPGGLHIMLINLVAPLKSGEQVEITLVFEDGSEQTISADVKTVEAGMNMHHHH
jgi:hypothetical protein